MDLLLHGSTQTVIEACLGHNAHALLLTAPTGAGKATVAHFIAAKALATMTEMVAEHPYVRMIKPEKESIGIETIRELRHFLHLRTTGTNLIRRCVIIEDAQTMTIEAQNALLKTLEEPPEDTLLVLTSPNSLELKQTILSRVQRIEILPVSLSAATSYFKTSHSASEVEKAFNISRGYVGLMVAILENKEEHGLLQAIELMKELLGSDTFGRLIRVDELAKDKESLPMLLRALSLIASSALAAAVHKNNKTGIRRWQRAYRAAYEAEAALRYKPNSKLLLTNLMLVV